MKTVCKKLLSLMLVAVLLVSAVPFQASAAEVTETPTETTTTPTETTAAAAEPVALASVVEETTAPETTAATEAPVGTVTENVAQQPAVSAINDEAYIYYILAGAEGVADAGDEVISTVKTKIGARVSGVPGATTILDRYAKIFGSSAGKQFDHWELAGEYVNPANLYVTDDNSGGALYLYAVVTDKPQSVRLNLDGGKASTNSISVTVGGVYPELPIPTKAHYDFAGWYWKNSNNLDVQVNAGDTVYDTKELKAKWTLKQYVVNYQKFSAGGTSEADWVDSGFGAVVNAKSTVSVANGTFPTDAQIQTYFALPGYTIVGWEIGDTDTAFKAGSTQITDNMVIRPRYQRTVTLEARNPETAVSYSRKTITVEIGEPFGAIVKTLPNPGARDGHTFNAWLVAGTKIEVKDLSNPSSHPLYYDGLGYTFEAEFVDAEFIYLHIHTDGNTKTAAKIVPYYLAPANGVFDMTLINMYSIFPSYGDYDDTVDYAHGWFNDAQWERYSTGKSADNAMYYEELVEQVAANGNNFYIMLYNGGTSSSVNSSSANANGYNNNASTADPSNPTTGDQIFMAVTVLALSASALALVFFLNKKRKAC